MINDGIILYNQMLLDFKDVKSWDFIVAKTLCNLLGNSYSNIIKDNAELVQDRDSCEEIGSLFENCASLDEMREEVMAGFLHCFKDVVVYHACRPKRVDDYYNRGIVPLSSNKAQKQFRDNFCAYFSEKDIDTAIALVSLNTREGVVYASLDDRTFIDLCGHYLIYGSEYQNCLTINLPGASESTRDILKMIGIATVFVCRLPFSSLKDLNSLASSMISDHFFRIAHNQEKVTTIDHAIILNEIIPPACIVRHYYPIRIKDPFKGFSIWNDEMMRYE